MSQLYQTAVWKEALRSTESEPRKMLPCAFHKGEEEGLLCCGDRGSLKDAVSIVKEGLCVWWGSQCGHCEGEAAGIRCQSEEGELFWFSIWCFVATVGIKCSFGFFLTRERGGQWGIRCLSRLWYGCVGGGRWWTQESNVITGYMKPLCMSVVTV